MNESQFLNAYKTLSKKEAKDFMRLVQSPFDNRDNDLIRLLSYVELESPDFAENKLRKEVLFKKLFPKEKYNDQVMRELLVKLLKRLYDFFTIREAEKHHTKESRHLIRQLIDRKLYKAALKKLEEAEFKLDEVKTTYHDYFIEKYYLLYLRSEIAFHLYQVDVSGFLSEFRFEELEHSISNFYYMHMLENFSQLQMISNTVNLTFDEEPYMALYEKLYSKVDELELPIQLEVLRIHLNKNSSIETYKQLKKLFIANLSKLSDLMIANTFSTISNYCNELVRQGRIEFRQEIFEINKLKLEKGVIIQNGNINANVFQNIAHNAIVLGEYDWAKAFIDQNKSMVLSQFRSIKTDLLSAELFFYQSDYENALKLLATIPYDSADSQIFIKLLYIQIYYELKDYELFESTCKNLRQFINKEKGMTESVKEAHLNFITMIYQLHRFRIKEDILQLIKVENGLKRSGRIIIKEWLIEKLMELKKV